MVENRYDIFKKLPLPELAEKAFGGGAGSSLDIAKFILSEKLLEKQDEYNKKNIELQHELNSKLITRQIRWTKLSAIITAIATMLAVLLGWSLSECTRTHNLTRDTLQLIQPRTVPSTSASGYEKKDGKAP